MKVSTNKCFDNLRTITYRMGRKLCRKVTRTRLWLPSRAYPNREAFSMVGFTFYSEEKNGKVKAKLPRGWTVLKVGGGWYHIMDNHGARRVSVYCTSKTSHMTLEKRFSVGFVYSDKDSEYLNVCVIDSMGKVQFTAGACDEAYSEDFYHLEKVVRDYLNIHFPMWSLDPTAYWR